MHRLCILLTTAVAFPAHGQFVLQNSGTTASLRGIAIGDAKGHIAWASGSNGTVLRTLDGGAHWTACTLPPDTAKLDFRGIQASDADNAIVMASGKGDLSRIYKTSNGGVTWKLVLTNPDQPDGFFDALIFSRRDEGWILGDPVNGHFYLANTQDGGETWTQSKADGLGVASQAGAFAASNQSLLLSTFGPIFGGAGGHLLRGVWPECSQSTSYNDPGQCLDRIWFYKGQVPLAADNSTSGLFALSSNLDTMIAVGGDYSAPTSAAQTAAYSSDEGVTWQPSAAQPHGYRSSVAYDSNTHTWITVGPNGTDISMDDGRHWQPLIPNAAKGDAPDADRNWNALALPFAVGSKGRIGRLRDDAASREKTSSERSH